ncbi:MAG TPA: hypothetical protein VKD90_29850, partial [Gemmataceae bacterium]|nr:hypothetical protein [Gemmataceae bacterium]
MSTQAYVDLMFAWGHARLGDAETVRKSLSAAADQLTPLGDGNHDWLLKAFIHRIEQASQGQAHDGSWPDGFLVARDEEESLRPVGRIRNRFGADRLRAISRILEPVERADPYEPWKKGPTGPEW